VREPVRERERGRAAEDAAVGVEGADPALNCAAVAELVTDSGSDCGVLIADVLLVAIGGRLYFLLASGRLA
jgi:hypothetical protein